MAEINPMYNLINTIIDDKEIVIFMGAGASMEGKQNEQRFPGFDELIDRILIKYGFDPKNKKKRLDSFFSIIEQWEKEKKLSVRLSKFLDGEPGPAHYYLAALSTALFGESDALLYLTTNYDDLIIKAFIDLERNPERKFKTVSLPLRPNITGSEFQEIVSNIEGHLKEGRPVILKLFGDLNSQSPIFRQDDMRFEPEVEKRVIEWMKKPMIVIGYSFSDKILKELLIAARGTSPVFLVNPSKKIPPIIKNMDRVHHIKRNFYDFISDLLKIIKERKPAIGKRIDKITESLGPLKGHPDSQPTKDASNAWGVQQSLSNGAAEPVSISVRPKENGLYTNSWALVIGINHYKHGNIPNLNFAENDAKAVASCLPALGFPEENIRLLLGEQSQITREIVLNILETEINPNMNEDDRFLFYFAGHGVTYESNQQMWGYILLQNSEIYGKMPDPAAPYLKKIPAKSLEMQGFLDTVHSLPGKHKLLLIDSCFSGFMTHAREISERTVIDINKKLGQWTMFPVTQVITAGRSGQKSIEKEFYQHGVFTWHLLKALQGNADLRGDGVISFLDLANYIRDRVSQEKGVVQDPQVGTFGEGQFIFLYEKEDVKGMPLPTPKIHESNIQGNSGTAPTKPEENTYKIALQAHNGQYVAAAGGGGGKLVAKSDQINEWEMFNVVELPEGKVNLQVHNGQYVRAKGGGEGELIANSSSPQEFETFEMTFLEDNKITFQAHNGHFVSVRDEGEYELAANRRKPRAWEILTLTKL